MTVLVHLPIPSVAPSWRKRSIKSKVFMKWRQSVRSDLEAVRCTFYLWVYMSFLTHPHGFLYVYGEDIYYMGWLLRFDSRVLITWATYYFDLAKSLFTTGVSIIGRRLLLKSMICLFIWSLERISLMCLRILYWNTSQNSQSHHLVELVASYESVTPILSKRSYSTKRVRLFGGPTKRSI